MCIPDTAREMSLRTRCSELSKTRLCATGWAQPGGPQSKRNTAGDELRANSSRLIAAPCVVERVNAQPGGLRGKRMNGNARTIRRDKKNGLNFSGRLLLFLSRKPGSDDYPSGKEEWDLDGALSLLCRVFPNFMARFVGKEILDLGCGLGYQAVALARNGARYVLGIDTNEKRLAEARDLARKFGLERQVEFADRLEDRCKRRFDMVISQNSMEHYPDPLKTLEEMRWALNQDGSLLITFGPPWYAPYGSHMHFFTKVPWVNIFFDEKTVMKVRAYFRSDGATRY